MAPGSARAPGRPAIAAPVSLPEEVDGLADEGANELYCGVTPERWTERYGDAGWLNRRGAGKANLESLAELERLVRRAHERRLSVSVTVNAPYYTAEQLPAVVLLCGQLGQAGVDGLIVSDPGLMLALREAGARLRVTASSVAAIRNRGAAAFFCELGATRIILPRHLSVDAIEAIRGQVDVELEVFALNDGCVYEEGFCATTHAAGAFCLTEWEYDFTRADGAPPSAEEGRALAENVRDYREWTWYLANCGSTLSARRLPNGPCALCAVWDFHRMGIDCLKIVGREAHPQRKRRSVELVHAVVEMAAAGASKAEIRAFAREVRCTPEHCDAGYMCYYREVG